MSFYVYNLRGNNPYFNLAFEEYILSEYPKNDADIFLIFYENADSLILGRNLVKSQEVYSHKSTPPVIRRASGGGSVAHFPGNLNFGVIINVNAYPVYKHITKSYELILACVARSISGKLPVTQGGVSDLCINSASGQKKISGNSQVRKKNWLLHHGTLLYDIANVPKISHFLKHPPKEPDYRKGRHHKDFLVSYIPHTDKSALISKLIREFAKEFSQIPSMKKIPETLRISAVEYLNSHLSHRFRC